MILSTLVLALGSTVCGDPTPRSPSPPIQVLRPRAVLTPAGLIEGGAVLLRGDRILAVGASVPVPVGAREVPLDGILAPGLIDGWTRLGVVGRIDEASRYLTPQLRAADALDPDAGIWKQRLRAGITAVHLVPEVRGGGDPIDVLAGWSAVVRCAGPERILLATARETVGVLDGPADSRQGGPSALAGVLPVLRTELATRASAIADRGLLLFVQSADGLRGARAAAAGLPREWVAAADPASFGGLLRGARLGLPVVQESDWSPRRIETWKRLHAAGVKVVFGTGSGGPWVGPESLRQTAIAYARATGDPDAAFAAISSAAADFAGVGKGLGRIVPGAAADLVLWSRHPLDASARVVAVMIGGRTVWSASAEE